MQTFATLSINLIIAVEIASFVPYLRSNFLSGRKMNRNSTSPLTKHDKFHFSSQRYQIALYPPLKTGSISVLQNKLYRKNQQRIPRTWDCCCWPVFSLSNLMMHSSKVIYTNRVKHNMIPASSSSRVGWQSDPWQASIYLLTNQHPSLTFYIVLVLIQNYW